MRSTGEAEARPGSRGPGRPRAEGLDDRILDAVVELIDRDAPVTVGAVVAASGVSRAALYRRWPTMTDLTAAALDRGRSPISLDTTGDVKAAIVALLFDDPAGTRGTSYSERRFRKRLALVMANPELQQAYWRSHVHRRRRAMTAALQVAIERGELRADLDIDAALDLITGVFYYQVVVRGCAFGDRQMWVRCREAFDVAWRGMQP